MTSHDFPLQPIYDQLCDEHTRLARQELECPTPSADTPESPAGDAAPDATSWPSQPLA